MVTTTSTAVPAISTATAPAQLHQQPSVSTSGVATGGDNLNHPSSRVSNHNNNNNEYDNNSALDIAEQTQRPTDNALNQQRVDAWHPILDPVWVIIALFYLGIILVPVGKLVLIVNDDYFG
jgi:hypothetical protein